MRDAYSTYWQRMLLPHLISQPHLLSLSIRAVQHPPSQSVKN